MDYFGVSLDPAANCERAGTDRVISTPDSRTAVCVVYTNEEIVVARESVRVLGAE
jgi:acetate kinase